MDTLRQDIRFALRSLAKSPLLTAAAIASLGLGIGANASIFSAIDVFMIRPLAFERANELVAVWTTSPERGWTRASSSIPDYLDWRAESRALELAAYTSAGFNLAGADRVERLRGMRVSSNFFDVLRRRPVLGRGFRPEEERADGPRVAVLGDATWRNAFGAAPDIIGRVVRLDGEPYEIVGVMPRRVGFGGEPEIWVPFRFAGDEPRTSRSAAVLGRIRPGHDLNRARSELGMLQQRIGQVHTGSAGTGVNVVPLRQDWFNEGFRQGSLISGFAVFFVLLIACANVANLLLARAATREREVALRTVIGAGRGRIVRQLLTESVGLALAGGALGLALSVIGIRGIRGLFPPGMIGIEDITLNARVVGFAVTLSLLSGLIFGLAPALRNAGVDLKTILTDAGRGTTGARGGRMRSALVVAEISLAMVLLVSSTLLVQAFVKIRTADLGFRVDDVVTMSIVLPATKYADVESLDAFQAQLFEGVRALPGVERVATTNALPMRDGRSQYYTLPDRPAPEPGREPVVGTRHVSAGYFEALDIRVVAGRGFTDRDTRGAPPVAVVNEIFAAQQWPDGSPVGRRITFAGVDYEIVGIAAATRDWGPDDDAPAQVFLPAAQLDNRTLHLVVRTSLPPAAVFEPIRDVVRAIDADQPVYGLVTLRDVLRDALGGSLAMAKVMAVLALIAFVLAAVGVYGVMAYTVAQRTQELGIRMAIGAQRPDVLRLVLRRGAIITGAGIGIGLLLSLGATRALAFFLFGVSPFHPFAFATVPLLLAATGLLASWLPALRATRVDPLIALRTG
jgi:putative ABC transport system permease protein